MAGTSALFDAAAFRTAIRATMTMGLPGSVADQATFRWSEVKSFTKQDSDAKPWLWTAATITDVVHADVQVPVAMEILRTVQQEGTSIGDFNVTRVILTLLDVDYDLIVGADVVLLGQNTYNIDFIEPPIGLFDVTVWRIHCRAGDES